MRLRSGKFCKVVPIVAALVLSLVCLHTWRHQMNVEHPIHKPWTKKRHHEPESSQYEPIEKCDPKQHVVCVKTHKTGGTTLSRIIEQYAVNNKLNIVRKIGTKGSIHYGGKHLNNNSRKRFLPPRGVKPGDFKNYKYNVFSLHAVFDRNVFTSFINGTPFFVTVIRNPVEQFESSFDFFHVGKIVKGTKSKSQKLTKFVLNIESYFSKMKGKTHAVHNNQLWDLGVDATKISIPNLINNTLKKLDNDIDLVLINELYDESLIIMKKKLCWGFEDILYLPRNQRLARAEIRDDVREKIEKINTADVELYKYFMNKLHRHILEYGPEFNAELIAFREMTKMLYDVCVDGTGTHKGKKVKLLLNNNITSSRCVETTNSSSGCSFTGGYRINVNLNEVCKRITAVDEELNKEVRKMMKSNITLTI